MFVEYNVEFQHIERQRNIVVNALSQSFPKVFHKHVLFAVTQLSNAIQIPQSARKDQDRDTSEPTESQKVSCEHTFFAIAQPFNAK
jgi:hypothetical protein